jgi:ribosome maturation factor RimP
MEVTERVRELCEPVVADLDVELYDVERAGGILRVTVDQPGGVPLEVVSEATRRISRLLDEHDPVPGRYTLEVTSPGLERKLRTPAHFAGAIGQPVTIKARTADGSRRRLRGVLAAVDDSGVTVLTGPADATGDAADDDGDGDGDDIPNQVCVAYENVDSARTVFEWTGGSTDGLRRQQSLIPSHSSSGADDDRDVRGDDRDDDRDDDKDEVSSS